MALKLIREAERLRWTDEGEVKPGQPDTRAWIEYRRLPSHKRSELIKRHERKGKLDQEAVFTDCLKWAIYDWGNFIDPINGNEVPYSSDECENLPESIRNLMSGLLLAATDTEAEMAGNSPAPFEGASKTKGSTAGSAGTTTTPEDSPSPASDPDPTRESAPSG